MERRQRCLESLVIDPGFWRKRRVFLTGHTGFKGAWMALLLRSMEAEVWGFSLPSEHAKGMFCVTGVEDDLYHEIGDIRDLDLLRASIKRAEPEIVIHMAAQALVRRSYLDPVETYSTNVMGTVNLLEAVRLVSGIKAVAIVTSDKCYENTGTGIPFHESDPLGGFDPYSSSKAGAEIVTAAYRRSFFHGVGATQIATARAGNVIGGGDWARDRLVPDMMRSFIRGESAKIRNPNAVRPWQHVTDPLVGYLLLCEALYTSAEFASSWNFGPLTASHVAVAELADALARNWGPDAKWEIAGSDHFHEAAVLQLDCSKAVGRLNWRPLTEYDATLALTVDWYRAFNEGHDMRRFSLGQIARIASKFQPVEVRKGKV
jgi:CDP-glucose 4,6-dehydratase